MANDKYMSGDIPAGIDVTLSAPSSKRFANYNSFVSAIMNDVANNASAYMSNRVSAARGVKGTNEDKLAAVAGAQQLSKILVGASFIPAHPSGFGAGQMKDVTQFVFHRPDAIRDWNGNVRPPNKFGTFTDEYGVVRGSSCTLQNLITTFAKYDPAGNASTHFIVGYSGELVQMVDLADEAYHYGKGTSQHSVGVEMEGAIEEPMTVQQLRKVAWLVAMMSQIYGFAIDATTCRLHSDLWPKERRDPGPLFPIDWVLKQANLIKTSTPTPPALWFQKPFTVVDVYTQQLRKIAEDAGVLTGPARANLIAALAKANSRVRTDSMASPISREELAASSVAHAQRRLGYDSIDLAGRSAVDALSLYQPVAQTAISGLQYDFDKGLWNDGNQV
jgi:hypothetical protein